MTRTWLYACAAAGMIVYLSAAGADPVQVASRVQAEHLPNVVQIHERVLSGGLPEGEAGFAELQQLGVRTIISVDGARPDIELAKEYGLRYVHLPHGYDGISAAHGERLAKAVTTLPGPIYIHCHHGKHRSPAAAAVACVAGGLIEPSSAADILRYAGTSEHYRGLYRAAAGARPLAADALDKVPAEFPELVAPPPMTQAMVEIEHLHDRLKQFSERKWQPTAGDAAAKDRSENKASADATHEALLLREQFTELLRSEHLNEFPEEFRQWTQASEQAARQLEKALEQWQQRGVSSPAPPRLDRHLGVISENCTRCHHRFRDGS